MNRQGPGVAPLANRTNIPSQSAFQPRTQTLSSNGRLTMNKGSGSGWGMNPSSIGQQGQLRDSGATGSYARATNTPQSQTQLDLNSDFPSLTDNAQSQNQPSAQSFWGSRTLQQEPSQAQQRSQHSPPQSRTRVRQHLAGRQDMFSGSATQAGSGLDTDRFSSEGPFNHNRQPQNESSDLWPRIGETNRQHDASAQDGYGSSGFGSSVLLSGLDRQRTNTISGTTAVGSSDPSRVTSPEGANQGFLSSRSPMSGLNGTIGQERPSGDVPNGPPGLDTLRTVRQNDFPRSSPQSTTTSSQPLRAAFEGQEGNSMDTPISASHSAGHQTLSQMFANMTDREKFGVQGFMAMNRGPSADIRSLTVGQDIHTLGLDLRQSTPLHTNFMGPFAAPGAPPPRPLDSDFTLPACYSVMNVVPLDQRINGFSEETLFYIFYSMPRDIMQEMVAEELMGRKWRFHKVEKMWVTRDESAPNPVEVERGVSESGTYIWWDYKMWRRVRKPFVLRYEDLDDHLSRVGGAAGGAVGGGLRENGSGFNAVPGLERLAAGLGGVFR